PDDLEIIVKADIHTSSTRADSKLEGGGHGLGVRDVLAVVQRHDWFYATGGSAVLFRKCSLRAVVQFRFEQLFGCSFRTVCQQSRAITRR
ncbi:MAG: hypothetical protein AAF471_09380, partial [Myxococcota bacterium]